MNDSKMEKTLLLGAGLLFACSGMWKLYDVIFAPSEPVIIENTEVTDAVSTITGTVASSSKTKAASEPTSEEFIFLDLNTADVSELEKLSGIGAQTAARIVGYREEHGGFRNIEEIMNVSGIGEATFSDIKEHIFVVDPVYEMEPVTETEPVTEAATERTETEPETEPVLTLEEAAPININSADKELLGTWEENTACFEAGETVSGIVRSVEEYGVFVELAPNLAGLAELRSDVHAGESVSVYIKAIIPEKMKVKLVIVDVCEECIPCRDFSYFCEDGHISEWDYAPAVSDKSIYTKFD